MPVDVVVVGTACRAHDEGADGEERKEPEVWEWAYARNLRQRHPPPARQQ